MIELTNFTYKTNKVLFDGASFKAPSTGMIGIAGESGCGKTTFLKIISKQIHLASIVNNAPSIFYEKQD
uniref:ATP-binding cassette domain-containing protein n=1 Tax=Catenibacterium sp. TaxID=2049022 RepID=UPI004029EDCA